MNWLAPLTAEIQSSGAPQAQTDALVLAALTLDALCETFVPKAPAPHFEQCPPDDEDEGGPDLQLAWLWQPAMRSLTVTAEHSGAVFATLRHQGYGPHLIIRPTAEQLRVALTSFFDGWSP